MIDVLSFPTTSSGGTAKQLWETLYPNDTNRPPFGLFEWHRLWLELLGNNQEPFPLRFNESVILPLVREGQTALFSGGIEISDYMDCIGDTGLFADAWIEALPFLKNHGITTLTLPNVPESSPTYAYFSQMQSKDSRACVIKEEDSTPIVTFPHTWEEYLARLDRKDRHEYERKIRKFEREHPDAAVVESSSAKSEISELLRLMKLNPDKHGFLSGSMEQFFQGLPGIIPQQSVFLVLRVNNQAASIVFAFRVGDAFYLYNSGFDETHFSGAGFYLKAKSIRYAFEQKYKTYNFLQGKERYKYELGGKDFFVYRITVPL